MPANPEVFVHPAALCESEEVGVGTRIWAFAHVMRGAVIGRDCNIGDHAFVEAGARIGNRVTIKNQAMVWDGIEIGDDVFIGPGVCFTNDLAPRSPRSVFQAKGGKIRRARRVARNDQRRMRGKPRCPKRDPRGYLDWRVCDDRRRVRRHP